MIIVPTEKRFDWKHTPVVLFAIVLLNGLVFFAYQSGDSGKFQRAMLGYTSQDYLALEWPLFTQYLASKGENAALARYQGWYDSGEVQALTAHLLLRVDFYEHLKIDPEGYFGMVKAEGWRSNRTRINAEIAATSYVAHGLTPARLQLHTLLSHLFLHGGVLHLLGNMFFLVVCGFAVEAALGHWRFLGFYLLSGLAGGLLHTLFQLGSHSALVGASGAVSGVMAMYLGVFQLKRIEFFYWFFVFVGYFRAPALAILPFYIGKELISFFSDSDSNVAFLAHTGGFIAGAAAIAVSLKLQPDMLNQEYIEEEQDEDPRQRQLAEVYQLIGKFRFDAANQALAPLLAAQPDDFELALLHYNLLKIRKAEGFLAALQTLLATKHPSPQELQVLEGAWRDNPQERDQLAEEVTLRLGMNLAGLSDLSSAEQVFEHLHQHRSQHPSFGVFARKLALTHERLKNFGKKKYYEQIADQLLQSGGSAAP